VVKKLLLVTFLGLGVLVEQQLVEDGTNLFEM
jgi:hypothetical protein